MKTRIINIAIPYLLIFLILFMGMTGKSYIQTCGKRMITEMTFASGVTGPTLIQTEDMPINGKCTQIEVDIAENTTNNITYTVAVTTVDGGSLYSQASIPDNGATIYRAYSKGATDSDFEAFLMAEVVTVTVTASGDPGTTGATVNVGFYIE
jgi:hypothetical protein